MPTLTYYVVQGFKQVQGAIVAVEPKIAPGAASAKALAELLALTHVGVIGWSKTGDADLGKGSRRKSYSGPAPSRTNSRPAAGLSNAKPLGSQRGYKQVALWT
jgi:hypothetical protein